MESKPWVGRALALALLVPVASACSKGEKNEENIEVKTETPPPAAPITVTINPQGGAKLTGQLTATHETDKTVLRLNLSGLDADKDYKAKIRYGDCTVAMKYLADTDEPGEVDKNKAPATTGAPATGANPPTATPGETVRNHDIGDVVARIDLDKTGATATGSADVDNDKLGPDEPAYVVITEDMGVGKNDMFVGCADLTGHAGLGATPGGAAPAGTTPGAAAPSTTTPSTTTPSTAPAAPGKKKY